MATLCAPFFGYDLAAVLVNGLTAAVLWTLQDGARRHAQADRRMAAEEVSRFGGWPLRRSADRRMAAHGAGLGPEVGTSQLRRFLDLQRRSASVDWRFLVKMLQPCTPVSRHAPHKQFTTASLGL